jgi:S1-C subfamily serine protease
MLDNNKVVFWGVLKSNEKRVSQLFAKWLADNQVLADNISFAPLSATAQSAYSMVSGLKSRDFDTTGRVPLIVASMPSTKPLTTVDLFKTLAPSIYIVVTNTDAGDTLQGSAVAVSKDALLTNCHVLKDATTIELSQKGATQKATLASADFDRDRCVLKPDGDLPRYVSIRAYDDLNIGERVFTIGAPAGLELTLADGLLSGKRSDQGRRLVQTTASISPGSSGGGLFDEYGNLIGITTFGLKDSQNLNFAISAEDYVRP